MRKITMVDILQMPVEDRIDLVQDIWDSIWEVPDTRVSDEEKRELVARLEEHRKNPEAAIPWEKVRAQFIK